MFEDKVILKDEILNIMIAGRDTVSSLPRYICVVGYNNRTPLQTATTLTFATYLLAMHPEAVVRLRNEILEKVGPSRCPTYDDIREMKYLRAFINGTCTDCTIKCSVLLTYFHLTETLRLFPAV